MEITIGHFTVVYSVSRPINSSKAAGDLVLIQTSLFLSCKSCCCDANYPAFTKEKQRGLYQNKVTGSLAAIHRPGNSATTVKWSIGVKFWKVLKIN